MLVYFDAAELERGRSDCEICSGNQDTRVRLRGCGFVMVIAIVWSLLVLGWLYFSGHFRSFNCENMHMLPVSNVL